MVPFLLSSVIVLVSRLLFAPTPRRATLARADRGAGDVRAVGCAWCARRSRVVLTAAVEQVIIVPSGCSLESFFAPHCAGEVSPLSVLRCHLELDSGWVCRWLLVCWWLSFGFCVVVPAPVQNASPNAIVHITSHQQPRSHARQSTRARARSTKGGTGKIRYKSSKLRT